MVDCLDIYLNCKHNQLELNWQVVVLWEST